MATQAWVRETLERHQVPFRETHHSTTYTAQQLAEQEHISGHRVAKVVTVIADGVCCHAVLPASRKVDLRRLGDVLGAVNIRLANENEIGSRFTDCEIGAMPPLRRNDSIDILMDESLRTDGDIVFPSGTHEDSIRMRFDDWYRITQPRSASFSQSIRPRGSRFTSRDIEEDWEY